MGAPRKKNAVVAVTSRTHSISQFLLQWTNENNADDTKSRGKHGPRAHSSSDNKGTANIQQVTETDRRR